MTATIQFANHRVLRGVGAFLAKMRVSFARGAKAQQKTFQGDARWLEMIAAGDVLIEAMQLQLEFGRIDLMSDEDAERWRAHRKYVERIASQYGTSVANWRED